MREAGRIYYGAWSDAFREHGLLARPAIGDHEHGDNPWTEPLRAALVPTFKAAWADAFTVQHGRYVFASHPRSGTQHAGTAYAFTRPPVTFVSIDAFNRRRDGTTHLEVVGEQLRWLHQVLEAANADPAVKFIVVQGHVPVLRPPAGFHSSTLMMRRGRRSAFWKMLRSHGVDLYLSGEWHVIDARNDGGVEQITHGSVLGAGAYNYLAVDVSASDLTLTVYRARVRYLDRSRLWQIGHAFPLARPLVLGFVRAGSMTITANGREINRRGLLRSAAH